MMSYWMDMVDYGCLELKQYGQKLPTKPQALRDSMNNFSITYDFIFSAPQQKLI